MASAAVVLLTLFALACGGACGLITLLLARASGMARRTAFSWGAALGPLGIVVVVATATKNAFRKKYT